MKILIVDDSMTSRMLFGACMPKGKKHEVSEAGNLPDALAKAKKSPPDLVVLDYNIPEHNGVEIAKVFQKAGINAKMVMLTASTEKGVTESALEAGFVHVLQKPINPAKVADLIKLIEDLAP
ncbi:MAG: response regulator [Gallionella sp.]|nr:response regulator [Gallionella sp.]